MSGNEVRPRPWGREPGGVPLDFAIIGAQKAASTFFQHRLGEHPDITVLPRENRSFEDPEYGHAGMAELSRLLAPHVTDVTGLKRPDYLPKHEVPERVARQVPRIRLLSVLREPVARAVSAYFHLAVFGFVPVMDPSAAMTEILDGRMQRQHPKAQEILDYGRYAEQLRRWQGWFSREQFLVLLQEDVARDPTGSIATAVDFLAVDPSATIPQAQRATNVGVYWAPRVKLSATRARHYYDYDLGHGKVSPKKRLGPVDWGIVAGLTAVDKVFLRRLGRDHRPSIDPAVEQRLRDYYAADIRDLAGLLGRDLQAWQRSSR